MNRPAVAIAAFGALFAPRIAAACPQCASTPDGGFGQLVALGVFVMLPFALVAIVVRIVKRGDGTRLAAGTSVHPVRREEAP